MNIFYYLIFAILTFVFHVHANEPAALKLKIETKYPGGNGTVLKQEGNTVFLKHELRDSCWFFYWNICVVKPPRGTYTFTFSKGEVIGPHGPAISTDGISWHWAGKKSLVESKTRAQWIKRSKNTGKQSFRYTFTGKEKRVYFSRHFPYQLKRYKTLLKSIPGKYIRQKVLTKSRHGRDVPLLIIQKGKNPVKNYLFTCRHHACESPAAYPLEGIIRYLAVNAPEDVRFHIVPFVDIDGVEEGDQGKNRKPHDHNRDYIAKPIYPETKAIADYIRKQKFDLHLDMHSPGVAGQGRYKALFYNVPFKIYPRFSMFKKILLDTVAKQSNDILKLYNGQYDNIAAQPTTQTTATAFSLKNNTDLVITLEQCYFPLGKAFSQNDLIEFGKSLGKALCKYSSGTPQKLTKKYTYLSRQCIQNGSFEDGCANLMFPFAWTVRDRKYDPEGIIRESFDAHRGGKAVEVSSSGRGRVYILQKVKVSKPGKYVFKGYVKATEANSSVRPYVALFNYKTYKLIENYPKKLTFDDYSEIKLKINISELKSEMVFAVIAGIRGKGKALLDDFSFKKMP